MKKNLCGILIITAGILLAACNKKSQPVPAGPLPNTPVTNLDASFDSNYSHYIDAFGGHSTHNLHMAEFYTDPSNPSTRVYAGTVTVNNDIMTFDISNYNYFRQITDTNAQFLSWNVTGGGNVQEMSYSYHPIYPKFDYTSIPDTCTKALGISLNIRNLRNVDPAFFLCTATLVQNHSGLIQTTKKVDIATITNGTINFSPAELAGFSVNQNLYITISLSNYKYVILKSKRYLFKSSGYYMTESYLR